MIWKIIFYFFKFIDPESSHSFIIMCLRFGFYPRLKTFSMKTKVNGLFFKNPIGLAAGFDKNALIMKQISNMGFGFTEIGTITPKSQLGNKKPRIFRLINDQAIINRNGFNNDGMEVIKKRLIKYRKSYHLNSEFKLGINIGANKETNSKIDDYQILVSELSSYADYISINISSPNTPGLKDLQSKGQLLSLLKSVNQGVSNNKINKLNIPLFIKISPDISNINLDNIVKVAKKYNISGLIISNTTTSRNFKLTSSNKNEMGGLSGKPLFKKSTETLIRANKLSKSYGNEMYFIAVGGIDNPLSAYIKILSGAHLLQFYTSLIYQGPLVVKEILLGLENFKKRDNICNFDEVRGIVNSYDEAKKIAIYGLK